jgi:hypothetical protein
MRYHLSPIKFTAGLQPLMIKMKEDSVQYKGTTQRVKSLFTTYNTASFVVTHVRNDDALFPEQSFVLYTAVSSSQYKTIVRCFRSNLAQLEEEEYHRQLRETLEEEETDLAKCKAAEIITEHENMESSEKRLKTSTLTYSCPISLTSLSSSPAAQPNTTALDQLNNISFHVRGK